MKNHRKYTSFLLIIMLIFLYAPEPKVYAVTTPPAQPTGLTVENGDTMEVLRWTANTEVNLAGYNIYQNGVKINVSLVTKTFYNVVGLTDGQSYNFQISAVDTSNNESPLTSIVIGNPNVNTGSLLDLKPLSNGSVLGSQSRTTNLLTDNDLNTYDGYNYSYYWYDFSSPVTISSYLLKTSQTSARIEFYDSTGKLKYTISTPDRTGARVSIPQLSDIKRVAIYTYGSGNWYEFDVFNPTTYDTIAPATPTGFSVEDGTNMEVLRWTVNTDSDIYGYNVYRDGVKINSQVVTNNVYNLPGLTNGQNYNFQISAVDLAGNESALTSLVVGKPNVNTGSLLDLKTINNGNPLGTLNRTTNALTDNDLNTSDANPYNYYWYDFSSPVNISSYLLKTSQSSARIEFYDSNGKLKYTISSPDRTGARVSIPQLGDIKRVAVYTYGSASWYEFDVFNPTTYDTTAPATPTGLTVEDGTGMEVLRWNANTESDFYGYNIYRDGVKINSQVITNTVYNVPGLTNGQSYNFQISAVDLAGNESALTSLVVGNPNVNTGSLLDLKTINNGNPLGTLTRTTNVLTDNDLNTSDVNPYNYYWYDFSSPVNISSYLLKTSQGVGVNINFYDSGGKLKYTVSSPDKTGAKVSIPQLSDIKRVAIYTLGSASWYEFDLFNPTKYDTTAPSTPTGLTVEDGTGMEVLRWNANTESDFYGYNIYQDGVKINSQVVNNTVYNVTGLTNGQSYNFQISAVDYAGNESALTPILVGNPNVNTGSLLDLKPINAGNTLGTILKTTNILTDNDLNSYETAPYNYYWYDFSSPVNISSYLLKTSQGLGVNINFYDNNGTLLYTVTTPDKTGKIITIPEVDNVKRVAITSSSSSWYEFDVFNTSIPSVFSLNVPTSNVDFGPITIDGTIQTKKASLQSVQIQNTNNNSIGPWHLAVHSSSFTEVGGSRYTLNGATLALKSPSGVNPTNGTTSTPPTISPGDPWNIISGTPVNILSANSGQSGYFDVVFPSDALILSIDTSKVKMDNVTYPSGQTPFSATVTWDLSTGP